MDGKVFDSFADAQAQLDIWVEHYNTVRPHQGIGMVTPAQRFALADPTTLGPVEVITDRTDQPPVSGPTGRVVTRKVDNRGTFSFASTRYRAGVLLAGETVEISCDRGLVHVHHRGVLIETHARRHKVANEAQGLRRAVKKPDPAASEPVTQRPTASAVSVTREVDLSGNVSFAGTTYRVGNRYKRRQVQVAVVADTVEISVGEELIKTHRARHDRTREHGALANPGGRPNRTNAA